MSQNISDKDLLIEFQVQLEANKRMIEDQKFLMQQLQEVNDKLLKSEHLKTNFLSNIRNEINNPITSILELTKKISEADLSKEVIKKYASLVYNEVFNLDFQLRNIFASAEIEAGESRPAVSSVKAFSIINNAIRSYEHQIIKKHLKLIIINKISEDETFCTDPEKLYLITSNLISNAIVYSLNGGIIQIDCEIIENTLVVSVSDNGIGINEEDKSGIFDRFSQLETGTTKSFMGHGLGLCITKSLLEILNGEISLQSVIHQGSTFTFKINQSDYAENDDVMFSSDGNDFLFNGEEGSTF